MGQPELCVPARMALVSPNALNATFFILWNGVNLSYLATMKGEEDPEYACLRVYACAGWVAGWGKDCS